jgi:murein DD-endopeptidase MepM/ murein hydrolase activator NlpD
MSIPSHSTRRSALLAERSSTRSPASPVPGAVRIPVARPSRRTFRAAARSKRGMAALLLAWGFALTQGLPVNAAEPLAVSETGTRPAVDIRALQSVAVSSAAAVSPVSRDAFSITMPPPPPPPPVVLSGAGVRGAFVNVATSSVQWPFASSPISSGFGARKAPCRGCSSDHKGLDFTPGSGTPISAMADGVVREVNSSQGGLGTNVVIDHLIDGQLVTSVYGHMQAGSLPLIEGENVSVGTMVGRVGNTGASTGAHLHFEIHVKGSPVDPYAWLTTRVG